MKAKRILVFSMFILLSLVNYGIGEVILPYSEDFDGFTVGSTFDEWSDPYSLPPLGEVLGPDSRPFGEYIPFDNNYLFMSGTQGLSGGIGLLEPSESIIFNSAFASLPNPNFSPAGAFRGGASFNVNADSQYSRDAFVGVEVHGEMWQEPDDLEIYFNFGHIDNDFATEILLGTIGHGQIYDLNISLIPNFVTVSITGPSTNITYEHFFTNTFFAKEVWIGEGSYPAEEYGIGIDNVIITPEPMTILLIGLGGLLVRNNNKA